MKRVIACAVLAYAVVFALAVGGGTASGANTSGGREIFRVDTFGDEQLWTDTLQLHQAVATVSPGMALSVGLKVDVDALPQPVVKAIRAGQVNLNDPAVTTQLLSLNAVVGVIGKVSSSGELQSIGVTCALCHSTVDNSLTTGIGHRLDGWPNRDLNVGAIVALSPVLTADQKAVFNSWGPGRFDPRLQAFDGTSFIPLNSTTFPVLIPPAYGLQRVGFETVTADGPISYWNNYVGVSEMGGHGSFSDPRIGLTITQTPDLVTPKLPALRDYQLSLRAPAPPKGSFEPAAARRGERLFSGAARCASCHTPPAFTDVLNGPDPTVPLLHAPAETQMEPVYASRSATGKYRTAPLRGIWQHPPYFHDGSAADLLAVVNHYNAVFSLGLTEAQKKDLVEYLKSL
jgi:cytochrome c553/mono/diheme cytochrome c family protein